MTQPKQAIQKTSAPMGFFGTTIIIVLFGFCVCLATNGWVAYQSGFGVMQNSVINKSRQTLFDLNQRNAWAATFAIWSASRAQAIFSVDTHITEQTWSALSVSDPISSFTSKTVSETTKNFFQQSLIFISLSLWEFNLKSLALCISFWLILFAALIGVADGLCERYIRTAEGGRESTWLFHRITKPLNACAYLVLGVYFCFPTFLSATMCEFVLAGLSFCITRVKMACLKKYL